MENFQLIYRFCKRLTANPNFDVDYKGTDFAIKIKGRHAEPELLDYSIISPTSEPVRVAPTPHVIHSGNVGYFVKSMPSVPVCPLEPGMVVEIGQILGLCIFSDFYIPIRSEISGIFVEYVANDGESIEYGSPIARFSEVIR